MGKERGIYCIENLINNKKYIGQSKDIYGRLKHHSWCLNNGCHPNGHLQKAWNKYGSENFYMYKIELCNIEQIDDREIFYIDLFKTLFRLHGYNLDSGGNLNKKHSEETIEKIRKSNTGKTNSEETRIKISKNRKGKMCGENHFMYGKHMSEETKRKLSEINKGKFANEKHYEATKVICLNTKEIFNTMKQAGEKYNTNPFNISKCCKGLRLSSGKLSDGTPLQWALYFENEKYKMKTYEPKKNSKKISQYDLDGNFIGDYESAREAEKITGIGFRMISRVCNGIRPNTHGYIFKFCDK